MRSEVRMKVTKDQIDEGQDVFRPKRDTEDPTIMSIMTDKMSSKETKVNLHSWLSRRHIAG